MSKVRTLYERVTELENKIERLEKILWEALDRIDGYGIDMRDLVEKL